MQKGKSSISIAENIGIALIVFGVLLAVVAVSIGLGSANIGLQEAPSGAPAPPPSQGEALAVPTGSVQSSARALEGLDDLWMALSLLVPFLLFAGFTLARQPILAWGSQLVRDAFEGVYGTLAGSPLEVTAVRTTQVAAPALFLAFDLLLRGVLGLPLNQFGADVCLLVVTSTGGVAVGFAGGRRRLGRTYQLYLGLLLISGLTWVAVLRLVAVGRTLDGLAVGFLTLLLYGILVVITPLASLTVVASSGMERGTQFLIRRHKATIGRSRSNDVNLEDKSVSRTHAEIEYRRGNFYLRDRGSKFGTFVDDVEVLPGQRQKLGGRAKIELGNHTVLVFQQIGL